MRSSSFLVVVPTFFLSAAASLAAATPAVAQGQQPVSLYDLMGLKPPGLRGAELETAVSAAAPHPLGSEKNPVRTKGLAGQRAYLARLRCPDGNPPQVLGRGLGPPSPFGGVGDTYGVTCAGTKHQIEMDMYHEHVETRAVPGFTIVH